MPNYLTKEEIRQWRSSLERITLEDYAKKLGKEISNEKETNDMVDMVYKNSPTITYVVDEDMLLPKKKIKAERISSLAQQSFEREKEMSLEMKERDIINALNKSRQEAKKEAKKEIKMEVKEDVKNKSSKKTKKETTLTAKKAPKTVKAPKVSKSVKETKMADADILDDIQITFKKNLTPREQAVFEHFLNNKNQIVYAKELAQVLELPRDYVYKYIKNLRAKMNENAIQNADNGGFVLEVK